MNFFHEWFLNFEQKNFGPSAKNFRPTYQNYIPRIQIHFQRRKVFLVFLIKQILQIFFQKLIEKVADFGRKFFSRSSFPEKNSSEKRFLENCSWVFFGPWANRISDFCKSFQHGGWGVRKTIYVSRVPFRGKIIFGSNINLLIDKWQIVPKVSDVLLRNFQHGCQTKF